MTIRGIIKCHGIPKSYRYKKLGYQCKQASSILITVNNKILLKNLFLMVF